MTRLTTRLPPSQGPVPAIEEPIKSFIEAQPNGGMNTYLDPADLPNNTFTSLRNAVIIGDKLGKIFGSVLVPSTKPSSDPVLLYTTFNRFIATNFYLRFTKNKIYKNSLVSLTEVTSGAPYSITNNDHIHFTTLNDRFFFSVGNTNIQELDTGTSTYAALGNAPKYKYVCGFFNRLVGANLYDASTPNPTLIGWSGDLNFGEWNPATDVSAGSTPLLEAATDFADPITGLFSFASIMLILRERSLWTATKQGIASSPFAFQAAFTSGCDCPNSAAVKRDGVIWYDQLSNQVYDYTIGSKPMPVGDPVRLEIKKKVLDKRLPVGSFDPVANEYILTISSATSNTTYAYILNLNNNSWTERTIQSCTGIYSLAGLTSDLVINDLTGTIDNLMGIINDLSSITTNPPARFYTLKDGNILIESDIDTDNGTAITSEFVSKIYKTTDKAISVSRLRLTYTPLRIGSFTISYNNGHGWVVYKTISIVTIDLNRRAILTCAKHVRTREFQWKITSSTGNFYLLDYSIDIAQSDFGKI